MTEGSERRAKRGRLHRLVPCLSLGLALLLAASTARADDAREFQLALNRFEAAEYDEAAKRFAVLLDPSNPPCSSEAAAGKCRLTDPELVERARGLYATTLVALKRPSEADEQIKAILRNNPNYIPNPAVFPREVIDRFTDVRSKIEDELLAAQKQKADAERERLLAAQRARDAQKAYVAALERMAGRETIREPNSRWLALVPFGVGQFQNGDTGLGWLFFGVEALAGATSILSMAIVYDRASIDPDELTDAEGNQCGDACRAALRSQRDAWATVNRISFGVWAATTIVGIAQAQIAFVPERLTTRPRPLPKPPPPVPAVSILPGAGTIAVTGRF